MAITITPASLNFGNIPRFCGVATYSFTVRNDDPVNTATVGTINVPAGFTTDFAAATIGPSTSIIFTISLGDQVLGSAYGNFQIPTDLGTAATEISGTVFGNNYIVAMDGGARVRYASFGETPNWFWRPYTIPLANGGIKVGGYYQHGVYEEISRIGLIAPRYDTAIYGTYQESFLGGTRVRTKILDATVNTNYAMIPGTGGSEMSGGSTLATHIHFDGGLNWNGDAPETAAFNCLYSQSSIGGTLQIGGAADLLYIMGLPVVTGSFFIMLNHDNVYWLTCQPAIDLSATPIMAGAAILVTQLPVSGGALLPDQATPMIAELTAMWTPSVAGGAEGSGTGLHNEIYKSPIMLGGVETQPRGVVERIRFFQKIRTGVGRCLNNDNTIKDWEAFIQLRHHEQIRQTLYDTPQEVPVGYQLQHNPTWCEVGEQCDGIIAPTTIQQQFPHLPDKARADTLRDRAIARLT